MLSAEQKRMKFARSNKASSQMSVPQWSLDQESALLESRENMRSHSKDNKLIFTHLHPPERQETNTLSPSPSSPIFKIKGNFILTDDNNRLSPQQLNAPGLGTSLFKQAVGEYKKHIENAKAQRPKLILTKYMQKNFSNPSLIPTNQSSQPDSRNIRLQPINESRTLQQTQALRYLEMYEKKQQKFQILTDSENESLDIELLGDKREETKSVVMNIED